MKQNLLKHVSNILGWRTHRKLVVLESDDWGSIRMPSIAALQRLQGNGVSFGHEDTLRYNQNDTLANGDDLSALFAVLEKHKDGTGKPAVITAVSVVANPDFEKIQTHNFEQYFYEPFTETLNRYYPNANVFNYWKQGIESGIFVPQFHCREHLNVAAWMKALQQNEKDTMLAFNEGCWGFKNKNIYNVNYQAAFDLGDPNELSNHHQILKDGLILFEKLFGYRANFFVPPNGPFNNTLEKTAAEYGIQVMSASKLQREPIGNGKIRKRFHYLGQINSSKQVYLTRNCFFEPSQPGIDWVASCKKEIETAFYWNKPAVISSHRVNYIGGLKETNRKHGLEQLGKLLSEITRKWPSVEFITSDKLGQLIFNTKNGFDKTR